MVGKDAVGIELAVLRHELVVYEVIIGGQGNGIAGAVDKDCRKSPFFALLVGSDDGEVVAAIVLGREFIAVVEEGELPVGPRQRVAYPAGEFALRFIDKELCAVGLAITKYKVALRVAEGLGRIALAVLNLVVHVLVIDFHGGLQHIVEEVAEVAEGILPGLLRLHGVGARHPDVGREGRAVIAHEVDVLVGAHHGSLKGAGMAEVKAEVQARLQAAVAFYNLAGAVGQSCR